MCIRDRTTIVWERATGRPICNAIVWQDRRTAAVCDRLRADGHEPLIRSKTGLVPDAYFSGTKIAWILDHIPNARKMAEQGPVSYTHLRAHETRHDLVCRLLL